MPSLMRRKHHFSVIAATTTAMGLCLPASAQSGAVTSPDINAITLGDSYTIISTTPPPIINQVIVDAPLERAWKAWTDSEAMIEFMGWSAEIDARPGGNFHVNFVEDADTQIGRGNHGTVIGVEPMRMLSFTWMTPMGNEELSGNLTSVVLHFTALEGGEMTQVNLINTGYGTGPAWRAAYDYNVRGWDRVLAHFQYAMEVGPIDWKQRASDLRRDGTLEMWREYKRKVNRGEDPKGKKPAPQE